MILCFIFYFSLDSHFQGGYSLGTYLFGSDIIGRKLNIWKY